MIEDAEAEALRQLLTAAEGLRPKLLALLALGHQPVEGYAYAVKARVKSFDSSVEKILKKRAEGKEYNWKSLTDIIGIRMLCLWPDDILLVLEKLIRVVKDVSNSDLSSFISSDIAEIMTEVIVYKGPNSPAVYDVIKERIINWLGRDTRASLCVQEKPSPRERPYSSVHLVVWCRTIAGGGWLNIPVEVQVRTSLEDVWSEVEHRLKYKAAPVADDNTRARVAHKLLQDLKGQLDIAASTVLLARELLVPDPPAKILSPPRVGKADPLDHWGARGLDEKVQKEIVAVDTALNELYTAFEKDIDHRDSEVWSNRFHDARILVDKLIGRVDLLIDPEAAHADARWAFVSRMELAHLLFWRARMARAWAVVAQGGSDALEEADRASEACLKTYSGLAEDDRFEHFSLLWIRYGNALLELRGDFLSAEMFLKRAADALATDDSVTVDSPYRVIIPRLYAYCIWRTQEQRQQEAIKKYGKAPAVVGFDLDQLMRALDLMVPLLSLIEHVGHDHGPWNERDERMKVFNNFLSYAWEFAIRTVQAEHAELTVESIRSALPANVTEAALRDAYNRLKAAINSNEGQATEGQLHTYMTTALLVGDLAKMRSYARHLRDRLNQKVSLDGQEDDAATHMKRDLEQIEALETSDDDALS